MSDQVATFGDFTMSLANESVGHIYLRCLTCGEYACASANGESACGESANAPPFPQSILKVFDSVVVAFRDVESDVDDGALLAPPPCERSGRIANEYARLRDVLVY